MGQNTLTAQQTAKKNFLFIAVSKKKNTDMEKVKLIDFFFKVLHHHQKLITCSLADSPASH